MVTGLFACTAVVLVAAINRTLMNQVPLVYSEQSLPKTELHYLDLVLRLFSDGGRLLGRGLTTSGTAGLSFRDNLEDLKRAGKRGYFSKVKVK